MPTNIIETPSPTGTIVAPVGGDPVTAGSIVQGLQPIGNRLAHIQARQFVVSAAQEVAFQQSLIPHAAIGDFGYTVNGDDDYILQTGTTAPFVRVVILRRPSAPATLQTVSIRIKPAAGHGAMPENKPHLYLVRKVSHSSAWEAVADLEDPQTTVGPYEAEHAITLSSLGLAVDPEHELAITIEGESGTDSETDLEVRGILTLWDCGTHGA